MCVCARACVCVCGVGCTCVWGHCELCGLSCLPNRWRGAQAEQHTCTRAQVLTDTGEGGGNVQQGSVGDINTRTGLSQSEIHCWVTVSKTQTVDKHTTLHTHIVNHHIEIKGHLMGPCATIHRYRPAPIQSAPLQYTNCSAPNHCMLQTYSMVPLRNSWMVQHCVILNAHFHSSLGRSHS